MTLVDDLHERWVAPMVKAAYEIMVRKGHIPPPTLDGFEPPKTDMEPVICTGCWDNSDHDTDADNDVPEGEPVYYRRCSYEYDEYDSYCLKCATEIASEYLSPNITPRTGEGE